MQITLCDKCRKQDDYFNFNRYTRGKKEMILCKKCSDELSKVIDKFLNEKSNNRCCIFGF